MHLPHTTPVHTLTMHLPTHSVYICSGSAGGMYGVSCREKDEVCVGDTECAPESATNNANGNMYTDSATQKTNTSFQQDSTDHTNAGRCCGSIASASR